jgi:beta-glucanase (GH16 family)
MPVGDIAGWHQIFSDDFTTSVPVGSFPGSVYAGKWTAYPDGWKDTSKNGTYYPSKVLSVQNGVLNMYLHTENGIHMVSAPEPTLPGAVGHEGGLLYGRYTVRFRADSVPGYKTAWLLWPDSETWPQGGEMDFPEGDLTGTIDAFMHWQNGTSGSSQDAYSTNATYASWHTATIEWLPTSVTFVLDGQVIGRSTSNIPNTPMHLVLQTETSLNGVAPANSAAGNVQIAWVAAYTPAS